MTIKFDDKTPRRDRSFRVNVADAAKALGLEPKEVIAGSLELDLFNAEGRPMLRWEARRFLSDTELRTLLRTVLGEHGTNVVKEDEHDGPRDASAETGPASTEG